MRFILITLLSYSILLPAIAGFFRYKTINKKFYPFIYCIWAGTIAEVVATSLIVAGIRTYVNLNLYVLIEGYLVMSLFRNLKIIKERTFHLIIAGLLLVCILEVLYLRKDTLLSYYRIAYSLAIVMCSISWINRLLLKDERNLLRNSSFIMAVGFIIFYTYNITVHTYWKIYGSWSNEFILGIYNIKAYMNFLSNLLYFIAILWLPKKRGFILVS